MTKKRKLIAALISLVFILGFAPLSNACHTSAINNVSVVNNGNGTYTFTINLFINVGSLDGYDYGFALIFTGSKGTPVVQSGFTPKVTTPQDQLNGFTGSKIGTQAEAMTTNYFKSRYANMTNVLTYEAPDDGIGIGAGSTNYNATVVVTVSGCIQTIELDADIRSETSSNVPNSQCLKYNYPTTSCVTCTPPVISTQPTAQTVCTNANTTFTLAATGASGFQWQVNTGSGWSNITNNALYSGATTSTLSITGASAAMSGYQYQCIVQESVGTCPVTSNAVKLTVDNISATLAPTNVKCFGVASGSLLATPVAGTNPYTYTWSGAPAVTGNANSSLSAGSYTVTVTDAKSCSATTVAAISQPSAAITTSIAVTNTGCGTPSGSILVSPAGGTPNYTYSWSGTNSTNSNPTQLSAGSYTVTVTDANGCTISSSATVNGAVAPQAIMQGAVNVSCPNGSDGNGTVFALGGTTPYTYSWSNGQNDVSSNSTDKVSNLVGGNYTVTITDANSCTGTAALNISSPVAFSDTKVVTTATCNTANGTASLTISGGTNPYTYSWQQPGGQTTNIVNSLAAGIYSVTITDANGCTFLDTVNVQNALSPSVSIQNTASLLCYGDSTASLQANVSNGTPGYTYSWSGSTSTTNVASNLKAGSYSLTVTDSKGCQAHSSAVIAQPAQISPTLVVTQTTCGNNNGSILVTTTGGTPNYTFNWSGAISTDNNPTQLSAGNYTVTVSDANGCQAISTATIAPSTSVDAIMQGSVNVSCFNGNDGNGTVFALGGTPSYTYSWSTGQNDVSANTTDKITNLTAGTYTVTITDAAGCQGTATLILNQPSAAIADTKVVTSSGCSSPSGTAALTVSGGTGAYTYAWQQPISQTTSAINNLAAGIYSVTITDANGCTITDTVNVQSANGPILSLQITQAVLCFGDTNASITAQVSNGTPTYTYSWQGSHSTNNMATNLSAGGYNLTVTDANGCQAVSGVNITQPNSALQVSATAQNSACKVATGSIALTATGGTATYNYQWSGSGFTGSTLSQISQGTYTFTVTDANGCSVSKTASVSNANAPIVQLTSSGNSICSGSADTLWANAINGQRPFTYVWSGSSSTDTALVLNPLGNSAYSVTVTDDNGCQSVQTIAITVVKLPNYAINLPNLNGNACTPLTITMPSLSPGTSGATILWNYGDQTTDSAATHTYKLPGQFTITAIVDSAGCSSGPITANSPITVNASPVAQFVPSASPIYSGDQVQYVNISQGLTPQTTSHWDFADKTTSDSLSPYHSFTTGGTYCVTLTVTNSGCASTNSSCLTVVESCKWPNDTKVANVFTPNGDNNNDLFEIGSTGLASLHIEIYNRWGTMITEFDGMKGGWDGKDGSGLKAPEGGYFYIMNATCAADGKKKQLKGIVELIR